MKSFEQKTLKIVKKPWGMEEIWGYVPGKYLGKTITIVENQRLSRQFHKEKEETIYVIKGLLKLELGWDELKKSPVEVLVMNIGDHFHIPPGLIHRFCAYKGNVTLCEVSTHYPEDVVRLDDDYGR